MFWKIIFGALAVLATLWAAGFDFQAAKEAVTGAAQNNAESLTGAEQGDWGN